MGVVYDKQRQYDKAVSCYYAAVKADPKLDYVYNNLGYSQLLGGKTEKAIKSFQHAIRLNGENKRYHNNLALAYVMTDQFDLAAEQFSLVDTKGEAKAKMAKVLDNLGKSESNADMDKLFEAKEDTRVAEAETEPAGPVVVKKAIEPASLQVQTESRAPADAETTVAKSVGKAPAETAQPVIVHIPGLEEESQDGESMMIAEVVDAGEKSGRNSSAIKWVPWQEGETKKEENLSELTASSSDFATQPLHVSAVQIAAGRADVPDHAAPAAPAFSEVRTAARHVSSQPKQTPQPKIIEVAQVETPSPLLKQAYTVRPVTAVVHVRESGASSSLKVVTPSKGANADSAVIPPETRVIEVAAAEPQKSAETLAPAEPKLAVEDVEVELEIANGNGVNGMARKVAKYLEIRGFKVAEITNAHSKDHLHTKVLYSSGGKRDLERLLDELTVIKDVSNLIELEDLGRRIRVVVGKDMLPLEGKLASRTLN
jgi:hypothetical protein